jgi:hypothetical protein
VTDLKPVIAAESSTARKAIRICLTLGAVFLVSGWIAGFGMPGNRVLVLALLGSSVALFAVAMVLQLRRHAAPSVDLQARPPAMPQPAGPPAVPAVPAWASADDSLPERPAVRLPEPKVEAGSATSTAVGERR